MPRAIILGTAAAIPDEKHENTHLAIIGERQVLLIDTTGSPIVRLKKAGIDPVKVSGIILTHFHPDHTYALPLLLMDMWLLGRKEELDIYGLEDTLVRAENMLDTYGWKKWPGFFQVYFHPISSPGQTRIIQNDEFVVTAAPVCHMIPTIGLRVQAKATGKILSYSCDTEPCQAVVDLACEADILIHESAGGNYGHTTPEQAGSIATQAKARSLYLIHYPVGEKYQPEEWINSAQNSFAGQVVLSQDFMELQF